MEGSYFYFPQTLVGFPFQKIDLLQKLFLVELKLPHLSKYNDEYQNFDTVVALDMQVDRLFLLLSRPTPQMRARLAGQAGGGENTKLIRS